MKIELGKTFLFFAAFTVRDQSVLGDSDKAGLRGQIFNDSLALWDLFRDKENGVYCDTINFPSTGTVTSCGPSNNFYSSAGTGIGLISKAIMAEYGYQSRGSAEQDVVQTLYTILESWPKDSASGFLVHFANRKNGGLHPLSEYSTIDSAELVLGALFAGNYFKGKPLELATRLRDSIQWSEAIKAADNPRIYPVVKPDTGEFSGNIAPYNEYYLVAYLANITSEESNSKAVQYFETYMATEGVPKGDGHHPVHKMYKNYDLMTDNPAIFMSSFIPQFCYYLARGFQENSYYMNSMLPDWFHADKEWWASVLPDDAKVWGAHVKDKVWGAGAGPSPTGYGVERIEGSKNLVVSPAIMAGFLPIANEEEKAEINTQLEWLYANNVCAYPLLKQNSNGDEIKVLWRCSIKQSEWRCPSVDSIDYSSFLLGYATNFLPSDFYRTFAA